MLAHRLRRWTNREPTMSEGVRHWSRILNVIPEKNPAVSDRPMRATRWLNSGTALCRSWVNVLRQVELLKERDCVSRCSSRIWSRQSRVVSGQDGACRENINTSTRACMQRAGNSAGCCITTRGRHGEKELSSSALQNQKTVAVTA